MSGGDASGVSQRKIDYFDRVSKLLAEYNKVLVVSVDNVGSAHMQSIRKMIRGKGVLLMGKNTLLRKSMREFIQRGHSELEGLIGNIYGNVGLVFVKSDLQEVKTLLVGNTVGAFAKVGSVSPIQVIVPKGDTGMDPSKTSFFQALSIQTKINKGKIEIMNDVPLLQKGDKVGASQAVLLQMLGIKPFNYGCKISTVYDNGQVIPVALFDMTDDMILAKIRHGVARIAALSLQIGHPTIASIPHSVARGFSNLVSVALATSATFKQVEQLKALLSDPEALKKAQAAAAAATGGGSSSTDVAPVKADEKKKKDDDDDAGGMGGLFGEDDDGGGGGMGGLFGEAEDD